MANERLVDAAGACFVTIDGEALQARFGAWRLRTPLANVTAVEITVPYAFVKTAGPAHLGITDRGLTFASNGDRGVLITFRRPVADVEGLAALLRERMAG